MSTSFDSGFFSVPNKSTSSLELTPKFLKKSQNAAYSNTTSRNDTRDFSTSPYKSPLKKRFQGDRFIPDRRNMELNASQYVLLKSSEKEISSPLQDNYKRSVARCLFSSDSTPNLLINSNSSSESIQKNEFSEDNNIVHQSSPIPIQSYKGSPSTIFSFSNRSTPVKYAGLKVIDHSTENSLRKNSAIRSINTVPERILDAPDLVDDFYLNLLDWSSKNMLAVALASNVYLWNASNGDIIEFLNLSKEEDYVSSLQFSADGRFLAVGCSGAEVQLWDVSQHRQLRNIVSHRARVACLSWNDQILSSGSRDTKIHNHDVRLPNHYISSFSAHSNEICGLKWSPCGTQLASGGNDNILNLWSMQNIHPLFTLTQHKAAVKSMAWCPWQSNLLASGGGSNDRTIKFWNTSLGTCLNSTDTGSQVCSVLWSKSLKELVSSHGFSQNQIIVWKHPTMIKQVELTGHTSRVLHMSMSPDGSTVVSAAADQTLRFWKIFETEATALKVQKSSSDRSLRLRTFIDSVYKLGNNLPLDSSRSKQLSPTNGLNIRSISLDRIKITFWEVGGNDGMRKIWKHYVLNSCAIIYIVDASDKNRLEMALSALIDVVDYSVSQKGPTDLIAILVNHQDERECLEQVGFITVGHWEAQIRTLARYRGKIYFFNICTQKATGIFSFLEYLQSFYGK